MPSTTPDFKIVVAGGCSLAVDSSGGSWTEAA
jgi:hypothetical protein